LSSANPRPRRTRAKVSVALGICLLTLSLATAQAIRAYVPAAETRPRLELVPGSDSSKACAVFPCGQASVEGSGEALVSMSLGIESPGPLQAETYYTDLLRLVNPTGQAVTVSSITVSEVSLTRSVALGAGFALGFSFTYRSLRSVEKEFDLRSLTVLWLLLAATSLVSSVIFPALAPYVLPAAQGAQPYSGLFFGLTSNVISNVPATQLVINTGAVTQGTAPLVAVEAGLAGNLGPIASFANLLALQIARGAGVPIKRVVVLQVVVGALAFLPALV
jgi:hypothetical protein